MDILTITLLIAFIFTVVLNFYTAIHVLIHHSNYGTKLMAFLLILNLIVGGIVYSTLAVLSFLVFFPDPQINITFLGVSFLFAFITLGNMLLIHSFLYEYKKVQIIPFLIYTSLTGLLIGSLFIPDSIILLNKLEINQFEWATNSQLLQYSFNFSISLILLITISFFMIYFLIITHLIMKNARDKETTQILSGNILLFMLPCIMFLLFVITGNTLFFIAHVFILWINMFTVDIMLTREPQMFLLITNKIYNVNIYHKSGVLLYSYNFKNVDNGADSKIWGNILIGINHILSEFVDPDDQIDVLQTKTSDIVVNYNNQYGFAVLVITNRKNEILAKFMQNFTKEFLERYKSELEEIQDLNKMINVSQFEDTEEIIKKNFSLYLGNGKQKGKKEFVTN